MPRAQGVIGPRGNVRRDGKKRRNHPGPCHTSQKRRGTERAGMTCHTRHISARHTHAATAAAARPERPRRPAAPRRPGDRPAALRSASAWPGRSPRARSPPATPRGSTARRTRRCTAGSPPRSPPTTAATTRTAGSGAQPRSAEQQVPSGHELERRRLPGGEVRGAQPFAQSASERRVAQRPRLRVAATGSRHLVEVLGRRVRPPRQRREGSRPRVPRLGALHLETRPPQHRRQLEHRPHHGRRGPDAGHRRPHRNPHPQSRPGLLDARQLRPPREHRQQQRGVLHRGRQRPVRGEAGPVGPADADRGHRLPRPA